MSRHTTLRLIELQEELRQNDWIDWFEGEDDGRTFYTCQRCYHIFEDSIEWSELPIYCPHCGGRINYVTQEEQNRLSYIQACDAKYDMQACK